MAVIPSFSGIPRGPDLAGARHNALSLIESSRQANANIALQRQKLAQDAQMANMQFQTAQQQMRNDAMRRASELAIDKAYKEATIGLQERKLSMAEAQIEQEAQAVARSFAAKERIGQLVQGGMSYEEAIKLEGINLQPNDLSAASRIMSPQMGNIPLGERIPIEGTDKFGVRSGPQTMSIVNPDEGPSQMEKDIMKGEISDLRMEIRRMKSMRDNPRSFLTDEERADFNEQISQLEDELKAKKQDAIGRKPSPQSANRFRWDSQNNRLIEVR